MTDTPETPPAPDREPFGVVGIGASAGGLESLEQFFDQLPADPGMAFVVVQHLSPDFRSMMSELLSRHCVMPVCVAEDGVEVEPDRVYLLPPRKEITIERGRLCLADKDPARTLTLPIDRFFRSLAVDRGPAAVAVVLSGSGSDGSRGAREIKRAGGRVLAETPESAKFDGMPLSTLATGLVDYSGAPPDLARYLLGQVVPSADPDDEPVDEPPTERVLRLLRRQFGLDFSQYKRSTVGRRIARRMALREIEHVEDYLEQLRADPDEPGQLYQDLLIGVTRFFRDPEAFEAVEQRVIPELLSRTAEDEEIRVWVAGCATGEEAYSLAILLFEGLSARDRAINFKILATDVHRTSLEHGSTGIYREAQLEHVDPRRRRRFFSKGPGGFQVSQDLRQRIVFAPHNVTADAPFTRMHLITCRNLLIYLEPEAQKTVISLFHFGLVSGGVLFLGSSETTGAFAPEFDVLDEHWKLYRKRRDVRLLDPMRLPIARKTLGVAARQLAPLRPSAPDPQLLSIYDRLLDRYMPPGFLVGEDRHLVDSFGGAERHLQVSRRRPTTQILDMLEGDLRTVVAGALQRVFGGGGAVRYAGVPAPVPGGMTRVSLSAEAFTSPRTGVRHALITLEDEQRPAPEPAEATERSLAAIDADEVSEERMSMLESELAYTRETLQAAVEEQQTSNEELQATNEELVASNEELQSTNEELHSVNEELYTVNGEYQKKIIELRELNDDMQHLLEGTDIGTLFLDRRLCIRKFTPSIAGVFHIRAEDVGRDITDFSHDLERSGLFDEIRRVLAEGVVIEDEVQDRHGTTFFLRILPYRPSPDARDVDPEGQGSGARRDGSDGMIGASDDTRSGTRDDMQRAIAGAPDPAADDTLHAITGGLAPIHGRRPLRTPGEPRADRVVGVMLSLTDISALDHARARINQLSAIVESSDDAIIGKDLDGIITSWNRGAQRLYGYTPEEAIGRDIAMLAPPGYEAQIAEFTEAIRRGERIMHVETVRAHQDGTLLDVSVTISPIYDRDGCIVGASAIARDISALKRAQREVEAREAHIRLLLDSTAEAIYGIDPDGICTFCNPACARLLGYDSADDLIGRRMHALVHHSRADGNPYPEEECPIYSVLHTGEGTHSADEVLYRADGSCFPAEYWSYPIGRNGDFEGAVVTFLDITERKQATREIRLAAERREQFLAMLSHELRNPLAAVLSATRLIQAAPDDGAAQAKARQVIERQSKHMARLLDDLLDVSRITRGGIELRTEAVDLRESVQLAIEASTPLLDAREIDLRVDLPDDPLPVRGDRARLQQIVSNLLTNAARYSPVGTRVDLRARCDDERVELLVEDGGYGIAPELLPQIFDLFVQTEQGLDRSEGGLGVGLALVRKLVELHGGEVLAHSDGADRGSAFRVTLPRHAPGLPTAEPSRPPAGTGRQRVVLVEDQADAREMLKAVLEAMGFEVFEASDGEQAIATIARVRPDVALVDIGLPVIDGFEVARRLRAKPELDDVLLVALTGYGTEDDIEAARAAGFGEHLTKPADPKQIEEIIARRT